MNRKDFLKLMGLSATSFVSLNLLSSCNSDDSPTAPVNIDFTIDLDDPNYSYLKTIGEFLFKDNVIIAHTIEDTYVALSAICTHEAKRITYNDANNNFVCTRHQSIFTLNGKVIKGPANKPLKQYIVELNSSLLRVQS
ncbi:MAG: QcrA and Rieske domain-containing protein [Candidatus Kapaibacteriales bacterium]